MKALKPELVNIVLIIGTPKKGIKRPQHGMQHQICSEDFNTHALQHASDKQGFVLRHCARES